MNANDRWGLCLLGTLVLALLLVGAVSGTLIRHLIQVLPATILVVIVLAWKPPAWPYAALAIHLFWLTIMLLIWLYLAGVARVVSGHFSASEVALTVVIGITTIGGSVLATVRTHLAPWSTRVAAFLTAAAIQIAAMWVSLQPGLATR